MPTALIVDDDHRNRTYLKGLLQQHAADVEVIGEAANISAAQEVMRRTMPDLVFLDVEMPGGSGFDLLRELGSWPFGVVFTTAYDHYAIQAIRFSALDYLLKPLQPAELVEAIGRFRQQQGEGATHALVQKQFITNIAQANEHALKLTLTVGDRTYFIAPSEVAYCTADGNYTELHLADGRHFISARTLKDYEGMFMPWDFLRIHRASLVNRNCVSHVADGHVVMKDGTRIEVSRRKWEEVRTKLAG